MKNKLLKNTEKIMFEYSSRLDKKTPELSRDLSNEILLKVAKTEEQKHSLKNKPKFYRRPFTQYSLAIAVFILTPFILFPPESFSNYSANEDFEKSLLALKQAFSEFSELFQGEQSVVFLTTTLIVCLFSVRAIHKSKSKLKTIALTIAILNGIGFLGSYLI